MRLYFISITFYHLHLLFNINCVSLAAVYVHVSELACNAARLIMLCQLYFDITPY